MKYRIALLSFFVTSMLASGYANADLNTGLVARWTFDDCTGTDATGRGHNGILFGSSSTCIAGPDKSNAFSFNGIDNYFRISNSSDFYINTKVSYSIWVNPTAFPVAGQGSSLLNKWIKGGEDKQIGLSEDGSLWFYLFDCMNRTSLGSKTKIPLNKWSHIAATYNGTTANIYINGALNSSVKTTPQCNVADKILGFFYIGDAPERRSIGEPVVPFQGAIDEIRVYNRTLSSTEVQQLYYKVFPPQISGTATWKTSHTVTCQNITQGTTITIPATTKDAWNCEAAGLQFNSGDTARITIDGKRY